MSSEVRVRSMAFSPDGSKLAVSSIVQLFTIVSVWDMESGELLAIANSGNFDDGNMRFAWSPDSNQLAFGELNNIGSTNVLTWNLEDIPAFVDIGALITDIAWTENGLFVSASGNQISLDPATATILDTTAVRTGNISPNGQLAALLEFDELQILDTQTDAVVFSYELEDAHAFRGPNLENAIWTSQNDLVVMSGRGTVFALFWDYETSTIQHRFDTLARDIDATAVSPDGSSVVWAVDRSIIELLDFKTGMISSSRVVNVFPTLGIALHPTDTLVAMGNAGGTLDGVRNVLVWDYENATVVQSPPQAGFGFSVAWSPDGSLLAVGSTTSGVEPLEGNEHANVSISDLDGNIVHQLFVESVIGDSFYRVKWSPNGRQIAGLMPSNQTGRTTLFVWDVETGELVWQRLVFGRDFVWLPDGQTILSIAFADPLSGDTEAFMQYIDVASGELDREIPQAYVPTTIALHPQNPNILAMHGREQLEIVDLTTNEVLASYTIDVVSPYAPLVWSGDGRFLAGDGTIDDDSLTSRINIYAVDDHWQITVATVAEGHFSSFFGIIGLDWVGDTLVSFSSIGDAIVWNVTDVE